MAARTYRIGEVHALLRAEFADLELSKIRYYENVGIVTPKRTKSKYRVFSAEDIDVLREALRMRAKDISLPDVRQRLIDRGMIAAPSSPTTTTHAQAARAVQTGSVSAKVSEIIAPAPAPKTAPVVMNIVSDEPSRTYGSEEFVATSGLTPRWMNDLQVQKFLLPAIVDGTLRFSHTDLVVAQRALVLLAQGVGVHQLTPLRRIVELELDFVRDITTPLRSKPAAERIAETRRVAGEIAALRSAVYENSIDTLQGK